MRLLARVPMVPGSGFQPFLDDALLQSIPQRFEQQVRAGPERLAIKWDRGNYDYRGLNATANRLARAILSRCGNAAEPVVLLFDHGGEALVAIMAVLKAGKFYVMLDPGYPPERLKFMLADSGARLMVADASQTVYARQLCGDAIDVIRFDDVDRELQAGDLGTYPAPDALAMVMYTSGSTGRPKGVMHSHRTILADARILTNGWCVSARDRCVLSASLSFASSVRTIYSSLLNGAAVLPYDARKHGFGGLPAWLDDNEITIVRAVPTSFRTFMGTLDDNRVFRSARVLAVGGEPMLRSDVEQFNRHFPPHCVLSHGFGPTECLTTCWSLVARDTPVTEGKLPIGHCVPDKEIVLLDESRREVADGEVGEIAVRSRYVSPGYWRSPEATAAAFLPDPAGGDLRTYLTGDLGRRMPDGTLVHVGRRDFQVKIRGFRVDVAEIENALRAVAGVGDAVVVGREMVPGEPRLVAYVVATTKPPIPARRLREAIARVLPDYMIPSAFVAMDALPRTPNGKADRMHLPLPERSRRDLETPWMPPGSPLESALAGIWADALDLDRVGMEDRFLDLGGDSLQAARIADRVTARFKLGIAVSTLFEADTVARMARTVAAALRDGAGSAPLELTRIRSPLHPPGRNAAADGASD